MSFLCLYQSMNSPNYSPFVSFGRFGPLRPFWHFHCFTYCSLDRSIQDILATSHIPQMHLDRTVAQISLIFSILNLVLAAPIAAREGYEAPRDSVVAMPKWGKLEVVDLSPRTIPGGTTPSTDPTDQSYWWWLDGQGQGEPSLPGPQPPLAASTHDSIPSSGPPPEVPPPPPPLPNHPSSSATSGSSVIPPSTQHMGSDSAPHRLGSPSLEPILEGSVEGSSPPHVSASGGSALSPLPPTETSPGFFKKNALKKAGVVAGAVIVGGTIAGSILASKKHHKHRDCEDC